MDSSPDLSLKLRRGSSDSRDNFYMDFAQGIDSDIEEVDNSVPPPPLPVAAAVPIASTSIASIATDTCSPSLVSTMAMPLPTLAETDDLPPTPPPMMLQLQQISQDLSSPLVSPTTSVLEMIPPPPLSPNMYASDVEDDTTGLDRPSERSQPIPEPPPEAESELKEDESYPVKSKADEDASNVHYDDDDDDDKSTPPPPLPPLPSNLSYVQGNVGGSGMKPSSSSVQSLTPPLTKSPSTSPSPPATPPPCPKLGISKIVSPPATHISQIPPLTPPSDSDQSQPNSPPPLPLHGGHGYAMPRSLASPPHSSSDQPADAPRSSGQQRNVQDEFNRSIDNDDESTTITTPPSNGYSASSIIAPPPENFAELDDDTGVMITNIPPPVGLDYGTDGADAIDREEEVDADDEHEDEIAEEEELKKEPAQINPDELSVGKISLDRLPPDGNGSELSPPLPESSSPPVISNAITSGYSKPDSRVQSRSVSLSGSRAGSRSGSIRGGSIGSRSGSIASASAVPIGGNGSGVLSPQSSIKSVKSSGLSIKSRNSNMSISAAPIPNERMQSPPIAESAPVMPSPPLMRSPPPEVSSAPRVMHSPPRVTTPPRVYSPPLISSPPTAKVAESNGQPTSFVAEPLPSPSVEAHAITRAIDSSTSNAGQEITSASAKTMLSYQNEQQQEPGVPIVGIPHPQVVRPHLSSHHHYHLPHQFQHPHHQNHHTHSVRVATPTVPAAYQHHTASGGGGGSGGSGGSGPEGRDSPRFAQRAAAHTLIGPAPASLLVMPLDSAVASVSPIKLTARLRDSVAQHHVTIDESNLPHKSDDEETVEGGGDVGDGNDGSEPPSSPGSSSQLQSTNLEGAASGDRQTGHLALMYHSHQLTSYPVLPAIKRTHRPSFVYPPMPRVKAGDALATLFSALYGKLLVVMGIAFPMAEVISTYIPPSFYEVYYLYLYIGSMIFLLFMYATLLWGRPKLPAPITSPSKSAKVRSASTDSMDESDTDSSTHRKHIPPAITARRPSLLSPLGRQHHYGSFYLRMGAVAFGIGSMIYSGLEFGQYFELNPDTKCHNVLLALTPATRMAFIFIQMYFIFLNNEQIKVYRYKIIARFGLMHMIGTNLAVWLNVLIQETKHEILTFYNPENRTLRISHRIPGHSRGHTTVLATADSTSHLRVPRGLKGPYQIFECRRTNIIGTLVQDASPFLFPCTIEYSLICAAILYVMWRSISRPQHPPQQRPDMISSPMKRSPHHYSVDCARAHKGLFVGILILVLTIISLILFFVLISRPDFVALAVTEVTICELLIYGTATIATLAGMFQIRHLQYDAYRSFSLDDILLVGAQTGSFLYNIFTVIAGHFTLHRDDMLVPINALASIVQTACQTMFILDASRRQAVSPEHIRKKPGREIVTFMLVVNLAMWAISTLEKSRAESHPIQLNFYGLWAWTIITHVSMPLAIFYRFHSTVCLCEIWKRAYKLKPTYM